MTRRDNNLSAGTQGAALTATNAGGTGNTNFSAAPILTNGSTITFDNTHGGIGGSAFMLKYLPGSGGAAHHRWTGFSAAVYKATTYLWFDTMPTADLWLRTFTNGATALRITLQSGGRIRITDTRGTTTPVYTSVNPIPSGQVVRIETTMVPNGATSRVIIGVYLGSGASFAPGESLSDTANNSLGTAPIDTDIMGKTDSSTYTAAWWMGGFRSDDAGTAPGTAPDASALPGPWPSAGSTPIRPAAVVSNPGGFTNVGGAASLAAALADELDTTMISSPDNPNNAQITFSQSDKLSAGIPTVTVKNNVSDNSRPASTTVDLMEGSTVRSSKTFAITTVAPAWQTDSWTLTQAESDSIGDRSNLNVRFSDSVG